MEKDCCDYYPTIEEIEKDGPFCWAGSDVSGGPACTKADGEKCQWAAERRSNE